MNKICVYTCITGNYDNLIEIKNKEENIDYYCFTNNKNLKSDTWNIVYIEDKNLKDVILARKIKILGHESINKKYDILVWMDAAIEFKKNIISFVNQFMDESNSFIAFKHGIRNSILEEMNACLRFRKEEYKKIFDLKEFYKKEKYNYDNGLIESTVLIKKTNDNKVIETMNLWFNMVKKYSKRDQLSFNYCIYKTNLNVKWINEYVFNNDWFIWHEHAKNNLPKEYMIYYGNIDEYDYKYQKIGKYKIEDDYLIIEEKIIHDTGSMYLELSDVPMIKYQIFSIDKEINIIYHNTIDYRDEIKVFFKIPGFVILNGNFKKNDTLKIKIKFEKIRDYEKNEIIEYLINFYNECNLYKIKYSDLCNSYQILQENYNLIINSKSFKITRPLRFMIRKLKNLKRK